MGIHRPIAFLATLVAATALASAMSTAAASTSKRTETPEADFQGALGYGIAVAISADGTTAVVGQLGDGGSAVPGVAHILTFDGSTWTQQTELVAHDASYDDLFGNAVAISADGNTVIVGDPGECGYGLKNCEQGAAYVFVREGSSWTQQAELRGGHGFGGSVALSGDGDTALVGAGLTGYYGYSYDGALPTVFDRSEATWTQVATLSAEDATGAFDSFGHSVALSADGHTAVIGDPTQDEAGGAAYIFTGGGTNWTQQAELHDGEAPAGTDFGASVAVSAEGHNALIGAPAQYGGSAYLYEDHGSGRAQQSELTPDDAEVTSFNGWFGNAVALNGEGNVALVGAPWADEDLGAVYAFAEQEESGWSQQTEIVLAGATPYDYFGDAVALDGQGNSALIGRYDPGASFFHVPLPADLARRRSAASSPKTTPGGASASTGTNLTGGTSTARKSRRLPLIGDLSISPTAFRAALTGRSAIAATSSYGAEVRYVLSAGGSVRFTVARFEPGNTTPSGRCERPGNTKSHAARRCTRRVAMPGSFTQVGRPGTDRFRFTGRLAGHRLPAGRYQLIAAATKEKTFGAATTARFSIR